MELQAVSFFHRGQHDHEPAPIAMVAGYAVLGPGPAMVAVHQRLDQVQTDTTPLDKNK